MHDWKELGDRSIFLTRRKEIMDKYVEFRKKIALEYRSVSDYLIHERYAQPLSRGERLVLEENLFPYDIEPDVQHLVLWDFRDCLWNHNQFDKVESSKTKQELNQLMVDYRQFLKKKFGPHSNLECTLRINPPEWQSVPSIPHCHVFLRVKTKA